ncbi:hypothetical protein Glove_99g311 [Diversispora epigaea]|uniref:Geranylgeranyl transferase type-2 subunit alpha n=1 Tax=Diversispora epigaea TaxID=1348612 RepID=A0A397J4J9_9GLOM|nr:hypothetical protein Glove_99g311 [Diversispora epigaea]
MHGVKRVKPSAEVEKLRKEREAIKIKEYNNLVASCFAKKTNFEYDEGAFDITTKILSQNPDFYTVWNFRRLILLNGTFKDCSLEEKQDRLGSELLFLQEIFKLNPKSYWIFNHRRWCLETIPDPDWHNELALVDKMLDMDSRNFHGWDYRRYVISKLTMHGDLKSLIQNEFDFTTTKINQNFSNYSAWHQRSKLLPKLIKEKNLNDQEIKEIINREFELVKSAFYTDPDDQSSWLYHRWLIGREIRHISILGAYFNRKRCQIILVFDDEIGMLSPFQVFCKSEKSSTINNINGDWQSLGVVEGGSVNIGDKIHGFFWIFTPSSQDIENEDFTELFFTVKPEWIVSSNSETILDKIIQRGCTIKKSENEKDILISMTSKTVIEDVSEQTINISSDLIHHESQETLPIDKSERIALLQREISTIRELLELEPDSKWCLQTLANLLREFKRINNSKEVKNFEVDEIVTIYDKLIVIDKMRAKRFEDLRSKIIFENSIRRFIQSADDLTSEMQQILSESSDNFLNIFKKLFCKPYHLAE